jgi:hypothetical protein
MAIFFAYGDQTRHPEIEHMSEMDFQKGRHLYDIRRTEGIQW